MLVTCDMSVRLYSKVGEAGCLSPATLVLICTVGMCTNCYQLALAIKAPLSEVSQYKNSLQAKISQRFARHEAVHVRHSFAETHCNFIDHLARLSDA